MGITKLLSLNYRLNVPGFIAAFMLFYIVSSDKPWWRMSGGLGEQRTFSANVSPFAVAVEILGKPVTVPIIPYLTLAARLSIILTATAMLVGSLLVKKTWSKPMMSIRGLILPILFLLGLYIGLRVAGSYIGVDLPLTGGFDLSYTIHHGELSINVLIPTVAGFTEEYWIALTAGIVSALARVIHGKIVSIG
ncbi:MAG: hypothetical protein FGF50_11955 [Candidatus Brockarchaeota archaeon]|nr:hypothetical protein [Candidatus Brockarchaeota archaeon]